MKQGQTVTVYSNYKSQPQIPSKATVIAIDDDAAFVKSVATGDEYWVSMDSIHEPEPTTKPTTHKDCIGKWDMVIDKEK